jgi:AcrR family transcriptional regulator
VSAPSRAEQTKERVRQARQEAYRGLILDAACRIFGERGYAEARVQEIAEAAGVATGTVYGIFPSKQELYRAVHRENLEALAVEYARIPTAASPAALMLARVATSTRFLTARPHYLRLYLREAGRWGFDPSALPPGATAFLDPSLYERGIASGELVDQDPALIQSLAMAAAQVHLYHWLAADMREPPDVLIARIQDFYQRALFRPGAPFAAADPSTRPGNPSAPG